MIFLFYKVSTPANVGYAGRIQKQGQACIPRV